MKKLIKKCIAGLLCTAIVFVTCQIASFASNTSASEYVESLKTAWQAMYEKNTVANIKTEKARNDSAYADLSTIGINFTDTSNSETGYTFNKIQHDSAVGYSNFLIFNSLYWDKWSNAYKWFDSGVTDNSFNDAFSKNDDIIFTVNTGELKNAGKLRIILRYNSWNTINKEIEFNESNKEISISFKELFELENLSDALSRPKALYGPDASDPDDPLIIVRIAFSSELETESAKLYPLKTVKYAPLPEGNATFTPLQWYNEAKKLDVTGYENTDAFTTALNDLENYLIENDPDIFVSELKTAWQSLYTESSIANFPIDSPVITSQHADDNIYTTDSGNFAQKFTFNQDGTFNKTPNPNNTTTYLRGMVFKLNNGNVFTWNSNSTNKNAFNNAFNNNDSLYFTFNPGTVNAKGNLLVLLQYSGDGGNNVLYAEVPVNVGDTGNKKIEIEKLTYKCADKTNYPNNEYTFTKPSDMLKSQVNNLDLHTIKIMFDATANVTNATVSSLQGVEYAPLPAKSEVPTALDWYKAAKKLDVNGYKNVADFNTALSNLKDYLIKNDPNNFYVSELETAWQSLYKESSIAHSPLTLPYMQNQMNSDNIIGTNDSIAKTFTFNESDTFDKTKATFETYARGLLFNINTDPLQLFTSSSSAFKNAFNNNDSLYFTFNPGTVNAGGNLLVILQYNENGTKYLRYAEVPVNVGDTGDKKIEIEKLTYKCADSTYGNYKFTKLSDMLNQFNSKDLFTIKIMFDKNVNIEGATIFGNFKPD